MAAQARINDIVKVDYKGRVFHARVVDIDQARKHARKILFIVPLERGITWRKITQSQVLDVYRRLNGKG